MKKTATRFFTPRLVVEQRQPAARQRSRAALPAEILPHLDGAYNLARYLTRDPVLSEDIVQDAFVRAFQAFGQFRGDSPRAWLFAIVRNCCRTAMSSAAAFGACCAKATFADDADELLNQPDPAPKPGRCGHPQ